MQRWEIYGRKELEDWTIVVAVMLNVEAIRDSEDRHDRKVSDDLILCKILVSLIELIFSTDSSRLCPAEWRIYLVMFGLRWTALLRFPCAVQQWRHVANQIVWHGTGAQTFDGNALYCILLPRISRKSVTWAIETRLHFLQNCVKIFETIPMIWKRSKNAPFHSIQPKLQTPSSLHSRTSNWVWYDVLLDRSRVLLLQHILYSEWNTANINITRYLECVLQL